MGHAVHVDEVVAASAVEYMPPPQLVHVGEAMTAAYLPAMQSTQVFALVATVVVEALPLAQLLHALLQFSMQLFSYWRLDQQS